MYYAEISQTTGIWLKSAGAGTVKCAAETKSVVNPGLAPLRLTQEYYEDNNGADKEKSQNSNNNNNNGADEAY